ELQQLTGKVPAAAGLRALTVVVLHVVEVHRQRLELLLKRRRSELSTRQLQYRRRERPVEFRREAPTLAKLRLRSSVWQTPLAACERRLVVGHSHRLADLWHRDSAERATVYSRAAARDR